MPEASATAAINPQPPPAGSDGAPRPRNRRRGGGKNLQQDRGEGASVNVGPDAQGARKARKPRAQGGATDGRSGEPSTTRPSDGRAPPRGPPGGRQGGRGGNGGGQAEQGAPPSGDNTRSRPPRRPRQANAAARTNEASSHANTDGNAAAAVEGPAERSNRPRRNRGRKFQGELTEGAPGEAAGQDVRSSERYRRSAPKADDLTSRLIHDLSTPPYPDCLICFAPITPMQATWSCSPSHPTMVGSDDEHDGAGSTQRADTAAQCCWMTFHLKCLHAWAAKSVKDVEEAWRARGEAKEGDWRCPGCQSKRKAVPSSYW